MYFLKYLLLYSRTQIRQTESIVMISKEGSTKIVNFKTPRAGVLVLRRGHISHIVKKNALFLEESSSLQSDIDQTNWEYSNDDQGRVYQNCKSNYPTGRGSCAWAWSYSEHAIFLLLFLPTLGDESNKLSKKQQGPRKGLPRL